MNKGGIIGTVIGLAVGAIGTYSYLEYRARRLADKWELFYDEIEEAASKEMSIDGEPRYEIGDTVMLINPHINAVLLSDNGDTLTFTVEDIKLDEKDNIYRYKLSGEEEWYAESWLDYEMYSPMTKDTSEMFERDNAVSDEQARKLEIDYWLATFADEKAKGNEEGIQRAVDEINKLREK